MIGGFYSLIYTLRVALRVGPLKLWDSLVRKSSCKTCALGMGGQKGGMTNELGRFPEVCKKSMQAATSDLQDKIPGHVFVESSLEELRRLSSRQVDQLGRLAKPIYLKPGDSHFTEVSWEGALGLLAQKLKASEPKKSFFYFSGRSSMEAGFLLQLFARLFGTNHVNNCSYYCHQPSGVGLTDSIGSGAATVTVEDVENCDLVLLVGCNPSSNHPRLLSSIQHMKKRGGRVIVINPLIEPGLVRFHIPSNVISLLFGTQIADRYVQPLVGGDQALFTGLSKIIVEGNFFNKRFIEKHTDGFQALKDFLAQQSLEELVGASGVSEKQMNQVVADMVDSKKMIIAWAMGITHHENGVANVQNLINVSLLMGMLGKPNAGLLPLRGHSNVQGIGTVGVTPQLKKQIFENLEKQGVSLPRFEGFDTMSCIESAHKGEMDFAWLLGGNLYESNPDLKFAKEAFSKISFSVHLTTTLNRGHIHAPTKEMLILPVLARDEEVQATTQESMFNFVRLSDGGASRHVGPKSEVEVVSKVAEMVCGTEAIDWRTLRSHRYIRQMIGDIVPGLEPLGEIGRDRKEFTIDGRIHHKPQFQTPSGRAQFKVHPVVQKNIPMGSFRLSSVRSEGQFFSVIYEEEDSFRGTTERNIVLICEEDMKNLGLSENQSVQIKSKSGDLSGLKIKPFPISKGCLAMYYPEANPLISRTCDPISKTPSFKYTVVELRPE